MCDLLLGIVDLLSFMLIVLPLYTNPVNGYIYSVNLFEYKITTVLNRLVFWILFIALIVIGLIKIVLTRLKVLKGNRILTWCSVVMSIFTILFLAMAGEPYAITVAFLLFIIKGVLIFKYLKA